MGLKPPLCRLEVELHGWDEPLALKINGGDLPRVPKQDHFCGSGHVAKQEVGRNGGGLVDD